MSALDDAPRIQPADRAAWRRWLAGHHATAAGAWVVTYKKASGKGSPAYEDLICEAPCFGWIDATARTVDAERTSLYSCPRRKGSVWAATNKARVERLIGWVDSAKRAQARERRADEAARQARQGLRAFP